MFRMIKITKKMYEYLKPFIFGFRIEICCMKLYAELPSIIVYIKKGKKDKVKLLLYLFFVLNKNFESINKLKWVKSWR